MNKLKYFLPLLFFIALGIFLMRGIELDPTELPSPLIDKPVPHFSLPVLSDEQVITENDLKGQVYLLNVWATWCISCKIEHPYLLELSRQGIAIIGVSYKDDNNKARQWLTNLGNPYLLNVIDQQGTLGLDLGVFGAPETFLVDKEGIIRFKRVGVIDAAVWQQQLLPVYKKYHAE